MAKSMQRLKGMVYKLINWFKKEHKKTKLLLKDMPVLWFTTFILAVFLMNLLASKPLISSNWIVLDCGYLISWISFFISDIIVKRYGAKASIRITSITVIINLFLMCCLGLAGLIPGDWCLNEYSSIISWWILLASSVAFLLSGIVNSVLNCMVTALFKKDNKSLKAYKISSHISTIIGQFLDNLLFGLIFTLPASYAGFYGNSPISIIAILMFAVTGAIIELLCQMIFSNVGYKVSKKWESEGIGNEYLEYIKNEKNIKE